MTSVPRPPAPAATWTVRIGAALSVLAAAFGLLVLKVVPHPTYEITFASPIDTCNDPYTLYIDTGGGGELRCTPSNTSWDPYAKRGDRASLPPAQRRQILERSVALYADGIITPNDEREIQQLAGGMADRLPQNRLRAALLWLAGALLMAGLLVLGAGLVARRRQHTP